MSGATGLVVLAIVVLIVYLAATGRLTTLVTTLKP